jgi:TrmH family RNA methyltransferase
MITSLQNPRVKLAARLRDRKGRDEQGRIIIDGAREIARAIAGGIAFAELFTCEALCDSAESRETLAVAKRAGAEIVAVSRPVMEKLAFGDRVEGLVATAETPNRSLADLQLSANTPLVAVLVGVEKPGNVGAVLRSADGAGVSALIVADGGTDLFNPNAIRASLGAIFTVHVRAATSADTLAWLRQQQLAIHAARVDGAVWYHQADFRQPAAIVLGSESAGLSDAWRAPDITAIKLPLLGQVDSLNVSATAAVLFYEAARQKSQISNFKSQI